MSSAATGHRCLKVIIEIGSDCDTGIAEWIERARLSENVTRAYGGKKRLSIAKTACEDGVRDGLRSRRRAVLRGEMGLDG